ncbi:Aste57867_9226 [Aphanomyces stellatus]|uniref:Aste57867_9226 protein n=1 Tax=Aphanomyces stellatus TaxID=120398 RepID=A0A485KM98_9STRA|nr:hypothetical protein As57867_009190 [Aphanomyces stellatus]VFT86109.1 Aste57867_9226 [Aphanomyces stellatus]
MHTLFSHDFTQYVASPSDDGPRDLAAKVRPPKLPPSNAASQICSTLAVDPNMTVQELLAQHLDKLPLQVKSPAVHHDQFERQAYLQRGQLVEAVVQASVARGLVDGGARGAVDLFSMDIFLTRVASLKQAFPPSWVHALAIKANPLSGVLLEAKHLGIGLETASYAEATHAIALGFSPRHVIVDSPCKTRDQLRDLLRLGCHINLDNQYEIHTVTALLRESSPPCSATIGLRINPVVGGGAIAASSTATTTSKFGLAWTPETDAALTALFHDHPWLAGVHVHVGSQGCALSLLVAGAQRAVAFAKQTNQRLGRRQIKVVDIGGGVPTVYNGLAQEAVEYADYAALLQASVPELFTGEFDVVTEFGRSVFAKAGVTLSRVETVKRWNGQNIAVVHCGANQFLRPVYLPKTWPHVFSVFDAHGKLKEGNLVPQDIAGPLCFSGDILARNVYLPQIEPGDHIVMHDTGAYTMAMYSKFNSIPAPATYAFRHKGNALQFGLVCAQETVDETLAFWGPKEPVAWMECIIKGFLRPWNQQKVRAAEGSGGMWARSAPKLARHVQRQAASGRRVVDKHVSMTQFQRRSISMDALRSSISTFPKTVIEDQLDIKALDNVNALVSSLQATPLPAEDKFMQWLDQHVPAASDAPEAFDDVVANAIETLTALETDAWNGVKVSDVAVADANAAHQALQYLLLKYKIKDAARYFELLDKESSGSIRTSQLRDLVLSYASASSEDWLEHHFRVLDGNADGLVTEEEMQQLLLNILGVHKSVAKDLLEHHTQHWTPKHTKWFPKVVAEYETTLKVTEKIRCTWHFAGVPPIPEEDMFKEPPPVPPRFTLSYAELQTSLGDEFPEFHTMLRHYTQAIVDGRREFYEKRNSKRVNQVRGLGFVVFCGITDYVISILV